MVSLLEEISEAVAKAESEAKVKELTQRAVDEGYSIKDILDNGLVKGITVIGQMWKDGEAFIPEVLVSSKMMRAGTEVIKELMAKSGIKPVGKVVMGTVEGDIHSIGRKIVSLLLECNGFNVIDLGVDVKPNVFAQAIEEHNPDVIGMSALLTTTMPYMRNTIDVLKERGLRERVRIIVGGAPITEEFAKSIGADGYAPEAFSAVEWVKKATSS